jgi:hypothetical protein
VVLVARKLYLVMDLVQCPLVALDDGENHDEELTREAEVSVELGWNQADGRIVGKGEGTIQLLDGFCPLNAQSHCGSR